MIAKKDAEAFHRYSFSEKKKRPRINRFLTPLKGTGRKRHFDFAVADIEAGNWIDFKCIGFYHARNDEYKYFESLGEFITEVYTYCEFEGITNVFIHNGGKYDFNFLIQEAVFSERYKIVHGSIIDRGSSFLSFRVIDIKNLDDNMKGVEFKQRPKIYELNFWDSLSLLPFSLKKMAKSFGVETLKGDIDYTHIPEIFENKNYLKKLLANPERYEVFHKNRLIKKHNPQHQKSNISYIDHALIKNPVKHEKIYNKNDLKKYLKDDCLALSQTLEKFYSLPPIKKVGPALTIGSQAIKVWRSYLKVKVTKMGNDSRQIALDGFYGGRTEMFRPIFTNCYDTKLNEIGFSKETLKEILKQKNKTLKAFDINSLYPSCMLYDMPIKCLSVDYSGKKFDLKKMGIYKVRVFVPDHLKIPPLPYRYTDEKTKQQSLLFATGTFEGTYTTYELNYAVSIGCKILKVYKGINLQNGGPIFKEYIEDMYEMRLQAKADGNDALQMTIKLLMNNTYGRLGMKLERTTVELDYGQMDVTEFREVKNPKTGKVVRLFKKDVTLDNVFTMEAIPAWITSIARVKMHKDVIMKAGYENCFYMDTDSLYTTADLPYSNKLGELDLEDEMNEGIFILPKTYVLNGIKDREYMIKHRMKGFQAKKIDHFTTNDFMTELVTIRDKSLKESEQDFPLQIDNEPKFATMKTALSKGFFLAMENDPATNKKADQNRLRMDQDELNYQLLQFDKLVREEAPSEQKANLEKTIKNIKNRIKSRNKKLAGVYGVSTRKVKAKYNKRIISENLMFTSPIKLEL